PEGPTKTTNSLDLMSRSTPLMTSTDPYDLRMPLRLRLLSSCSSFDRPEHALHELALQDEENDEGWKRCEHGRQQDDVVIGCIGGRERRHHQRDGLVFRRLQHDEWPEIVVPGVLVHDDRGGR